MACNASCKNAVFRFVSMFAPLFFGCCCLVQSKPQYAFGYEVDDYYNQLSHGRWEIRDGDVTQGQYRVLLPDGRSKWKKLICWDYSCVSTAFKYYFKNIYSTYVRIFIHGFSFSLSLIALHLYSFLGLLGLIVEGRNVVFLGYCVTSTLCLGIFNPFLHICLVKTCHFQFWLRVTLPTGFFILS